MKALNHKLIVLTVIAGIFLIGCKNDDPTEPSAQELAFELLAGNWSLNNGNIHVDGNDVSANFQGFSLSFDDGGYTTSNAGNLFSVSGTWSWVADSDRLIMLEDGKEITINTLNQNQFVFSFSFNGTGGVVSGLAGNYTIEVTK